MQMYHLSTEHRTLSDPSTLADNIAWHLREYQIYGRVAIVAKHPDTFLVSLKNAWNDLKEETRYHYEHTKDPSLRSKLINQLNFMPECTFTSKPPIEESFEKVQIATVEQFLSWAPQCQTMFITSPIERAQLYKVTSWMPKYGLLVIYRLPNERKK